MIIEALKVLSFFLVIVFGYEIANLFLPKERNLEKLSLGFILGMGVFTFVWFLKILKINFGGVITKCLKKGWRFARLAAVKSIKIPIAI